MQSSGIKNLVDTATTKCISPHVTSAEEVSLASCSLSRRWKRCLWVMLVAGVTRHLTARTGSNSWVTHSYHYFFEGSDNWWNSLLTILNAAPHQKCIGRIISKARFVRNSEGVNQSHTMQVNGVVGSITAATPAPSLLPFLTRGHSLWSVLSAMSHQCGSP